jgi:hypothetical protein
VERTSKTHLVFHPLFRVRACLLFQVVAFDAHSFAVAPKGTAGVSLFAQAQFHVFDL